MLLNVYDMDIYGELAPAGTFFDEFVKRYQSPDIYLWAEARDDFPCRFGWASPHLDTNAPAKELYNQIYSLKAVFDGAMRLYETCEWENPPLSNIIRGQYDSIHLNTVECDIRATPFSHDVIMKNFGEKFEPKTNVSRAIFLSRYDKKTLDILRYLSYQGVSYITLYAFYDWMKKGHWDDRRICTEAKWSKALLNDFTNTANNPVYLGPFCRHGGSSEPTPKRPMTLRAAIEGLFPAMRAYIKERATINNINAVLKARLRPSL